MNHSFSPSLADPCFVCSLCGLRVKTELSTTTVNRFASELLLCPGMPLYGSLADAPKTLANKTWFSQQSLESCSEPVAYYLNPNGCHPAYIALYPKQSAQPKAKKRPRESTSRKALRAVGIILNK